MSRIDRDFAHYERGHAACYHKPECIRCWFYAYWDLLRLVARTRGERP